MTKKNNFISQFGFYLLGAIVPMLIAFVKTPILTTYFSKKELGILAIVITTFTYLSMLSFSWIGNCMWRFYNRFNESKNLKHFYSVILGLYGISSAILIFIGLLFFIFNSNKNLSFIVCLALIYFLVKELVALEMINLRIKGKAKEHNLLKVINAIFSFLLLLLLLFEFNLRLEAIFISAIVFDLCLLIYLIFIERKEQISFFTLGAFKTSVLKVFFSYGSATLIVNLFLMLLASSDRYMILWLDSIENVGIYNESYKISEISIIALGFVFMSVVNPTLTKKIELEYSKIDSYLQKYLYASLLIGLPIISFCSIYAKQIANILLGKDFRIGYTIMPYIFFSAFIIVLLRFFEVKYKFSKRVKTLAINYGLFVLLNFVLNLILIPLYGYIAAAISSLICYAGMILLFFVKDNLGIVKNKQFIKVFWVAMVLFSFTIIHFFLMNRITHFLYPYLEAAIFLLIYYLIFRKEILQMKIPIEV